ncbi:cobalt-precorrin 5A hydrolase [Clostridium sp. D33t1_170424_F3]|uniref:cobalt-precorrin 5A hydrolase n=1 Tax=Clostridium sp. D33t1_170424_F3 TaxID=2787099 RepID=UPI0018AA3534|nr:cobalt-precorrin 5A hydrolase [Clostridium sp. D33t1_170424_F3]
MKIELIAFSARGAKLAAQTASLLEEAGHICQAFAPEKYAVQRSVMPLQQTLSGWTEQAFLHADALLFIGACGIAVRSIAPYLRSKKDDPAVLVMDECGRFVISLVSGHVGGANALAEEIAGWTGATPVITTATDVNGLFAVDTWAVENQMMVTDFAAAKAISSALLNGQTVGFYSDFPVQGALPKGLAWMQEGEIGIQVSLRSEPRFQTACWLIPRVLTVGIGCKKGISKEKIENAVKNALQGIGLYIKNIKKVTSIDLKTHEIGIFELCKAYKLDREFYTAEQLKQVSGRFSGSDFVKKVTGVDNVCERAAVIGGGRLILSKQVYDGVTVAVAAEPWTVVFSRAEGESI